MQRIAEGAMPSQLPEDARRRLEAGQGDLRDRCWHNVQRLHKWSGKLEREGPSGEDADYYESNGAAFAVSRPDCVGRADG